MSWVFNAEDHPWQYFHGKKKKKKKNFQLCPKFLEVILRSFGSDFRRLGKKFFFFEFGRENVGPGGLLHATHTKVRWNGVIQWFFCFVKNFQKIWVWSGFKWFWQTLTNFWPLKTSYHQKLSQKVSAKKKFDMTPRRILGAGAPPYPSSLVSYPRLPLRGRGEPRCLGAMHLSGAPMCYPTQILA